MNCMYLDITNRCKFEQTDAIHVLRDFKTSTILVYMILNGQGSNWLWSTWVQSIFRDLFFNRSIQCSWLFLNTFFALVSIVIFLLCFVVSINNSLTHGGEKEDYINLS